mgnify:CR=1 FL=1
MKKILSILYSLLRILPSNPFLNKLRGNVVSKLVDGDCKNLKITRNVILVNWKNIKIGNNVIINSDSALIATESKIEIGNDVLIAPRVFIQTQNHNFKNKDVLIKCQGETTKNVFIGNDVWIGNDVKIMDGVTIGNGAIIATGSIVNKNVEPYEIVGGIPAKRIRFRFSDDKILSLEELKWWDKDLIWLERNHHLFNNIDKVIECD